MDEVQKSALRKLLRVQKITQWRMTNEQLPNFMLEQEPWSTLNASRHVGTFSRSSLVSTRQYHTQLQMVPPCADTGRTSVQPTHRPDWRCTTLVFSFMFSRPRRFGNKMYLLPRTFNHNSDMRFYACTYWQHHQYQLGYLRFYVVYFALLFPLLFMLLFSLFVSSARTHAHTQFLFRNQTTHVLWLLKLTYTRLIKY